MDHHDLPLACMISLMFAYEIIRDTGIQGRYLGGGVSYIGEIDFSLRMKVNAS